MLFSVLTLFPELIEQVIQTSITGRALDAGLFHIQAINIRDFAINDYGKVDDSLCGGGVGMLMMCQPVYEAREYALKEAEKLNPAIRKKPRTLYLSPKGRVFNQEMVDELKEEEHLIFLCGHYEGIDQRVLDEIEAEEVSIGDFVLTGGELAASVMMDAIVRQLPGVLPSEDAFAQESHYGGRLECRQYTKPQVWRNRPVPEVLLGGHHKKIEEWRELDGLRETLLKRPDLFHRLSIDEDTWVRFIEFLKENPLPEDKQVRS